jgi:cell division protein FtsW
MISSYRDSKNGSSSPAVKNFINEVLTGVKEFVFQKKEPLDLGRRHRPKYSIFVLVAILLLVGMLVIFSIAPGQTWRGEGMSEAYFIGRQFIYLVVGLAAFFIASRISFNIWNRFAGILLLVALMACLLLAAAAALGLSIAVDANGAYRWISLGGFGTFQPAEFLKFAVVIFSASYLSAAVRRGEIDSISKTLLPLGIIVMFALIFIVIFQSDLSSGVVLIAIVLSQLILSGMRWRNVVLSLAPLAVGAIAAIAIAPYRLGRIATFLDSTATDEWDQISLSLMSLGSGGLFGKGLGQSVGAFGWVPEALNDAIFPIIGETFGYVGVLAILIVFCALIIRILSLSNYLPNMFLRLIIAGAFGWIFAQTVINIGAMIGVLPVTGITLPFLSFGGSSVLFLMLMIGVVFAVSRYTSHRKIKFNQEGIGSEGSLRRRGVGRSCYTNNRGY